MQNMHSPLCWWLSKNRDYNNKCMESPWLSHGRSVPRWSQDRARRRHFKFRAWVAEPHSGAFSQAGLLCKLYSTWQLVWTPSKIIVTRTVSGHLSARPGRGPGRRRGTVRCNWDTSCRWYFWCYDLNLGFSTTIVSLFFSATIAAVDCRTSGILCVHGHDQAWRTRDPSW